jgi:hypothetical protein
MALIYVIAALGAQLLPAIAWLASGRLKAFFLVTWVACLTWAVLVHASFVLAVQERDGQTRAEAVTSSQAPLHAPTRDLPAILHDKAELTDQLARLPNLACGTATCANRQRFRAEALNERRDALDAEAHLVADFDQRHLSQQEQRQRAMDDVVGSRLATVFRVSYTTVTFAMALGIAVILEGVGCLCWAFICKGGSVASTPATPLLNPAETEVAMLEAAPLPVDCDARTGTATEVAIPAPPATEDTSHDSSSTRGLETSNSHRDSSRQASPRARDFDADVARVMATASDSAIDLKVSSIRVFLGCGQEHARRVRDSVTGAINGSSSQQ